MTLRLRIVLTLVGLTALGLALAGFITNRQLEKSLVDRVDQQVSSVQPFVAAQVNPTQVNPGGPGNGGQFPSRPGGDIGQRSGLVPGTYGAVYSSTGALTSAEVYNYSTWTSTTETLEIPADAITAAQNGSSSTLTVDGPDGSGRYRVLVESNPGQVSTTDVLVVGVPLADVDATLKQLLTLELGVGALVLLVLAAISFFLVRAELTPLDRMGDTAAAIAAGDLTQRVDTVSPKTEVGRLGLALNNMISRIEQAFAERQASEDRLRRFVADASHELRTPLTSIRGYSEMFHRGAAAEPADLDTVMRRIEQESTRMGALVDDMLLLARLDQGRALAQDPVDLRALVADAAMDAQATAPDRVITVQAPRAIIVEGDEGRLRQVVGNLVRNAVVHTPPGSSIDIGLDRVSHEAVLTVADHGSGVPPEMAGRIFERFTRADSSRTRDSGGSGLGLSIVQAIVAAHDGRVELLTTPGGGATFKVSLPSP